MNDKKILPKIFENVSIRNMWDSDKNDYYWSVVDVIQALTDNDYQKSRNYWKWLKNKLKEEGSELVSQTNQLKLQSSDGKFYSTDTLDTKGILRLIQSVPSPKAEPFKLWLAKVGSDKIDETFDPALAIDRAITVYKQKGMSDEWIEKRIKGILHRNELTDTWKLGGINEPLEYAILTNEIYKSWSGMKASEYKDFKGIRKESLRDNMSDLEVLLADVGETATKELAKKYNPQGLKENKNIARRGGDVAKVTREKLEKEFGESVITNKNNINLKYVNGSKRISNK